jgi:hypothetical protein
MVMSVGIISVNGKNILCFLPLTLSVQMFQIKVVNLNGVVFDIMYPFFFYDGQIWTKIKFEREVLVWTLQNKI